MRHSRVPVTALLISCATVTMSSGLLRAQTPEVRPYETEEDIWEALGEGELSFEEFLELLDLHRTGSDGVITPPSDREQIPGSEVGYLMPDSQSALAEQVPSSASPISRIRWSTRSGIDAELTAEGRSNSYTVSRFRHPGGRGLLDYAHDGAGGEWRRRTLVWQPPWLTLQVGSIEPRWGRGIGIGRRSRVINPSTREGSFARPTHSRFDGLWFASDPNRILALEAIYSSLTDETLNDRVSGAQLVTRLRKLYVGVYGVSGQIGIEGRPDSSFCEDVIGGHVRMGGASRQLLAELAMNDVGASAKAVEAVWPLTHGHVHMRAWSYGAGFVNPWGGGPGHTDTRSVVLDGLSEDFASRVSGERGFDFTTRINASPQVMIRWDWMTHIESPGAPSEHSGVLRAQIRAGQWTMTPFVRGRIDDDGSESYSLGGRAVTTPATGRLDMRVEGGIHRTDEAPFMRVGFGGALRINRLVHLEPAIRWTDPDLTSSSDGYWYLYITETVIPLSNARLEATLVLKTHEQSDTRDAVEFRARVIVR